MPAGIVSASDKLQYRVICGDCRDFSVVERLLGGAKANLVITSPPYAAQREYDKSSGFKPIAPGAYVEWYRDVAANVASILAPDGSYFLNIKEHCKDGERSLYVKDLVLAHKREWGWMFVDEFCWRKTDNGVPGAWNDRFKNAWEPIFHFAKAGVEIKFFPYAVATESDGCFDYSPDNPMSKTGSELSSHGPDGSPTGRRSGFARPSNVLEYCPEKTQHEHSAPFPRALVDFFIKAFTEPGDMIFDPFLGSGTTMIAAMKLGRSCVGCEISPQYCDVIVNRAQAFAADKFHLDGDGRSFEELKAQRLA
jgi:site-specific DNA-methyltransferase (adenine-specific)